MRTLFQNHFRSAFHKGRSFTLRHLMDGRHALSLRTERDFFDPRVFKPHFRLMKSCFDCCHNKGSLCRIPFDDPFALFFFEDGIVAKNPAFKNHGQGLVLHEVLDVSPSELSLWLVPNTRYLYYLTI